MIIDSHAHAAQEEVLPVQFFDGWVDNLERLLPPDADPAQRTALSAAVHQACVSAEKTRQWRQCDSGAETSTAANIRISETK